jgi:hypothetical protein
MSVHVSNIKTAKFLLCIMSQFTTNFPNKFHLNQRTQEQSDLGLPHHFKCPGVIANGLTGINKASNVHIR